MLDTTCEVQQWLQCVHVFLKTSTDADILEDVDSWFGVIATVLIPDKAAVSAFCADLITSSSPLTEVEEVFQRNKWDNNEYVYNVMEKTNQFNDRNMGPLCLMLACSLQHGCYDKVIPTPITMLNELVITSFVRCIICKYNVQYTFL